MTLKQAAFTFSVPKPNANSAPVASGSTQPAMNLFSSPQSTISSPSTFSPTQPVPHISEGMDWTALTTFDPAVLSLLDEPVPQRTATSSAMNMDFGFGSKDDTNNSPFTTIAANPMFMSFTDFDADSSFTPPSTSSTSNFNFDFNSWSTSSQTNSNTAALDDLFSGSFAGKQDNVDINVLTSIESPVVYHRPSPGTETSGSSSSSGSTSNTSHQSPTSSAETSPDHDLFDEKGDPKRCPRTKAEAAAMLNTAEPSAFVKESTLHKEEISDLVNFVACKGSKLPSTTPRADDVEVLTAWRSVTKNPNFKVSCIQYIFLPLLTSLFRTPISMSFAQSLAARQDVTVVGWWLKDPVISNCLLNWLRSIQAHNKGEHTFSDVLDCNRRRTS